MSSLVNGLGSPINQFNGSYLQTETGISSIFVLTVPYPLNFLLVINRNGHQ